MGSRARNWPTAAISPSLAAIQMFGEGMLDTGIASFYDVGAECGVFLFLLCRCLLDFFFHGRVSGNDTP